MQTSFEYLAFAVVAAKAIDQKYYPEYIDSPGHDIYFFEDSASKMDYLNDVPFAC